MQIRHLVGSITSWSGAQSPEVLYDRQLVWISLGLMLTGLVIVTSASFPVSLRLTGQPFHFMFRHASFLLLAIFSSAVIVQVPLRRWQQYATWLLLVAVGLLFVVLIAGKSVNGASRWIPLGLFNLQPAEVAKLALFISQKRRGEIEFFWRFY